MASTVSGVRLLYQCVTASIDASARDTVFDTAEGYAEGNSEVEMGRVIKEMGWQRSDLIITTKVRLKRYDCKCHLR
jgi:aryl-alcohol dehydrogenase-like predicted oxidoreductase